MPVKKSDELVVTEEIKQQVIQQLSMDDLKDILGDKGFNDLSVPQKDEDGTIPQFVNVSGKEHKHCIYVGEGSCETIMIPKMGILYGAQWRKYAHSHRVWGNNPWYLERKKNEDGTFDDKYLLTEEQAVSFIKKIKNPKFRNRIRHFVDNSVMVWEDKQNATLKKTVEPKYGFELDARLRDDRSAVLVAEGEQYRYLDNAESNRPDMYDTGAVNDAYDKMKW